MQWGLESLLTSPSHLNNVRCCLTALPMWRFATKLASHHCLQTLHRAKRACAPLLRSRGNTPWLHMCLSVLRRAPAAPRAPSHLYRVGGLSGARRAQCDDGGHKAHPIWP
jgi:hypothetical protein